MVASKLGFVPGIVPAGAIPGSAMIRLQLSAPFDGQLGTEGYLLKIMPREILIRANLPAGVFTVYRPWGRCLTALKGVNYRR